MKSVIYIWNCVFILLISIIEEFFKNEYQHPSVQLVGKQETLEIECCSCGTQQPHFDEGVQSFCWWHKHPSCRNLKSKSSMIFVFMLFVFPRSLHPFMILSVVHDARFFGVFGCFCLLFLSRFHEFFNFRFTLIPKWPLTLVFGHFRSQFDNNAGGSSLAGWGDFIRHSPEIVGSMWWNAAVLLRKKWKLFAMRLVDVSKKRQARSKVPHQHFRKAKTKILR